MYYSITFTDSSGHKKNTWEDWRLIPTAPPQVESPEPYTNFVEIPGRVEGPIDLSEALSNGPSYQNSEGSWDFVINDDGFTRPVLFHVMKNFLHGRSMRVEFEEDPLHYYKGRFTVSAPQTGQGNSVISIGYTISPSRYNMSGTREGI